MATRALLDLRIFEYIVEEDRITSQKLSEVTKADKVLLGMSTTPTFGRALTLLAERLLRVLTASGYVIELDESTYGPNPVTKALATRQMAGLIEFMYVNVENLVRTD